MDVTGRGQGRRQREQEQGGHAQPQSTTSSTGCSRPCRPWAPAGARRACWASASAARPRRRCAGQGSADGRHRHVRTEGARPSNKLEELRIELHEKVNALGIGAQGLGGLTTVLDVKIKTYPTPRRQQSPWPMIPNCAATRHTSCWTALARPTWKPDRLARRHWAPDYNKSKRVVNEHAGSQLEA